MESNTKLNYKELCIFCFDVLINHLKKSKLDCEFPSNFLGVKINLNINIIQNITFSLIITNSRNLTLYS